MRALSIVIPEMAVVGLGLLVISALCFAVLYRFRTTDFHVVIGNRMKTGAESYIMVGIFIFLVGALFHFIFEVAGWNEAYCKSAFK